MAKLGKKIKTAKGLELKVVNPDAAGIDISPKELQVCVPVGRDAENNRTFGVYTRDLHEISAWLKRCRISTVVMESTGVYWLPIFEVLKEDGFDVLLVNAKDAKNYSGKKTDEADAEWLMLLHSYGLLRPCYQPENLTRKIRNLVRHRDALIKSSSREVLHIQKAMEQMNLKLDNVFSDILGKSGQAIINAILAGERDPEVLASNADLRCKKSREEIKLSLQATWDDDQLFIMKQSQELYLYYQEKIASCEREIEKYVKECTSAVKRKEGIAKEMERSGKRQSDRNKIAMDIEGYAFDLWGVNIMNIPGMSAPSTLRLVAELGENFIDKFEDARHFVSWANLVPNNKISGGKLLSSRVQKKKNPVGLIFRQCANSLYKSKEPMGDYFRHIKSRSGHMQAMVATGKKLATIFFTIISTKTEYNPDVYSNHRKAQLDRKIANLRNRLNRLENEKAACN